MNPEPTPATSARAGSTIAISLADLLVLAGTLIVLIFSGARTVSYAGSNGDGLSLWGSAFRPLGIFVILATLLLLGTAVVDTWWKRDQAKVGLNRHHLQVGLALFVLVDIFGFCFWGGSGVGVGWGGILQLLGALVAAAGAVLNHFGQMQNTVAIPNATAKPAPTYPPAQYSPGQVSVQPTDPAAPTAQMPAQDPNNPNG